MAATNRYGGAVHCRGLVDRVAAKEQFKILRNRKFLQNYFKFCENKIIDYLKILQKNSWKSDLTDKKSRYYILEAWGMNGEGWMRREELRGMKG